MKAFCYLKSNNNTFACNRADYVRIYKNIKMFKLKSEFHHTYLVMGFLGKDQFIRYDPLADVHFNKVYKVNSDYFLITTISEMEVIVYNSMPCQCMWLFLRDDSYSLDRQLYEIRYFIDEEWDSVSDV